MTLLSQYAFSGHSMTLNETHSRVLLEIGISPGNNAFSIAKDLDRDYGGINKVCGALRRRGLISTTTKTNTKNATVKELKLTLLGFALTLVTSHSKCMVDHDKSGNYRGTPEENKEFDSLLRNNCDLHEGLGIYYEYFSHYTQPDLSYSCITLLPLVEVLKKYSESYDFQAKHFPTDLGRLEWDDSIGSSLYKDLFFEIWGRVENQNMIRGDIDGDKMTFFTNQLLPRFKESGGWSEIVMELNLRILKCEQLRALKNLVD